MDTLTTTLINFKESKQINCLGYITLAISINWETSNIINFLVLLKDINYCYTQASFNNSKDFTDFGNLAKSTNSSILVKNLD